MKTFFALALLTADVLGQSGSAANDRELSLGGIKLGQTEASVVQQLGRPAARTQSAASDYLPVNLSYAGLQLSLDANGVGGMVSRSPKFCTPSGACPGMKVSRLKALYGSALTWEKTNGVPVGYLHGNGCWATFETRRGTVQGIAVACVP